jgi:hypothetical protein
MSDRLPRAFHRSFMSIVLGLLCGAGCSSSSSSPADAAVGGVVAGAVDMHCQNMTPVKVDPLSCNPPLDDASAPGDDGGTGASEFGDTMFNAEGDDDDCKYHMKFTDSAAPKVNEKVTFNLTLTYLATGAPATGAIDSQGDGVTIEAYLDSNHTHALPNTTPPLGATEKPAGSGVYVITPVQFDASGRWVVRFHVFETCSDALDTSPHGHGAFFIDVP